MHIYLVRMEHPDGEGWNQHVVEHVQYLKALIARGQLLASGPLKAGPGARRAGFIVMKAPDRAAVQALVDADPFAREGLICALTIEEWDPIFGMLAEHSSQSLPPELAALA